MEFVTIHDLSRELNVPARIIRYRLIQLIAEGKLKEHEDFHRADFKDDQHFLWKVHPLRFLQESGLKPVVASPLPTDNKSDNHSLPLVNQSSNNHAVPGTESPKIVTEPANNTGNSIDNNAGETTLAREMIDLLKDQIRVKDGQLREQGDQLKENHELTLKLTGTVLQQAQEIKTLLRLTGGKTEVPEVVTTEGGVVNDQSPSPTA
jgi:hypothetical protein